MEKEAFEKMNPEEKKETLEKRVAEYKVRCKNWPNCTNPTCKYSHPSEQVSLFLLQKLNYNFVLVSIFPYMLIWR